MKRDNTNHNQNNYNFSNANSYSQSKLQVNTDEEIDTDKDTDQPVNEDNQNLEKSLDDEESINQMKYKENFEKIEERLKYINKV